MQNSKHSTNLRHHDRKNRLLKKTETDVNAVVDTIRGGTLLLIASGKDGDVEIVRDLLNRGADVNLANKDGATPLYVASYYDNVPIVKVLLENGAAINECTTYGGRSPLYTACRRGNIHAVEVLLQQQEQEQEQQEEQQYQQQANVNVTTNAGETPLSTACYFNHKAIVKLLLQNGAYANGDNTSSSTSSTSSNDDNTSSTTCGSNDNDDKGSNQKKCRSIIDGDAIRPLHIACRRGFWHVTNMLLQYGANINQQTKTNHRNKNTKTPLWLASIHGHDEVVELLLRKGVNIHVCNKGIVPTTTTTTTSMAAAPLLFTACRRGSLGIVRALLERKKGKVDVNSLAPEGREANTTFSSCNTTAPLLIAVSREQTSLVEMLLVQYNADPTILRDDCQRPMDIARNNGFRTITRLLLKERLNRKNE